MILRALFYVLVLSPIALGLPLNHVLRAAERRGSLSWWQYALGGRDVRDAWDLAFQRAAVAGAWVLVHLKGDAPEAPRVVLGKYGKASAAGQSPAEHDLFLQALGVLSGRRRKPRSPSPAAPEPRAR
jgi:hypothetical protein